MRIKCPLSGSNYHLSDNVCARKTIIKAAKRIFNSDKICRSYCDFYFGVTFGTQYVVYRMAVLQQDIDQCQ